MKISSEMVFSWTFKKCCRLSIIILLIKIRIMQIKIPVTYQLNLVQVSALDLNKILTQRNKLQDLYHC